MGIMFVFVQMMVMRAMVLSVVWIAKAREEVGYHRVKLRYVLYWKKISMRNSATQRVT